MARPQLTRIIMAQIPNDQKFHTLNASTPTKERGSAQADGLREVYTMQDIIDTTGGGGGTSGIDLSIVVRSSAYSVDGDHEGTVLNNNSGVAAVATVNRWNGSAYAAANASAEATSTGVLVLGTSNTPGSSVLKSGIMYSTSIPGSAGDVLFLDTSAGGLTNDISAFTQGQIVRVCGQNLGGNKMYFDPSPNWIEIA